MEIDRFAYAPEVVGNTGSVALVYALLVIIPVCAAIWFVGGVYIDYMDGIGPHPGMTEIGMAVCTAINTVVLIGLFSRIDDARRRVEEASAIVGSGSPVTAEDLSEKVGIPLWVARRCIEGDYGH